MAMTATPGKMRTRIRVQAFGVQKVAGGFERKAWVDVFPAEAVIKCAWANAHGVEAMTASTMQLREPATLTLRYSPLITPQCRILREDDPNPYEIISLDVVREKRDWLEIKVKRVVDA